MNFRLIGRCGMTYYKTVEPFDAYICCLGRVQVPKGAEYIVKYDGSVYFLNSKNYLPCSAIDLFLEVPKRTLQMERGAD